MDSRLELFYLCTDCYMLHYQLALSAGATSDMAPADQFWGDRTASVHDHFGNIWHIATRIEDVPHEELERRIAAMAG